MVDRGKIGIMYVNAVFRLCGQLETIKWDQELRLRLKLWKYVCERLGIKQSLSIGFYPPTDDQTETVNTVRNSISETL
jgi:hypothetical protein